MSAPVFSWSMRALAYFESHAIDPHLAAALGVAERDDSLVFTVRTEEGSFQRTRPLDGSPTKVLQPPGQFLAVWWPRGRAEYAQTVLVVEGESDALSAATVLAGGPLGPFNELPIAAIPGTGFPAGRLAAELRRVECEFAYLAFDADDAGRCCTRRVRHALDLARIRSAPVSLSDGADLADAAAAVPKAERGEWMASLLLDAEGANL